MGVKSEPESARSELPSDSVAADDEDIAIMSNSLRISDHEQRCELLVAWFA